MSSSSYSRTDAGAYRASVAVAPTPNALAVLEPGPRRLPDRNWIRRLVVGVAILGLAVAPCAWEVTVTAPTSGAPIDATALMWDQAH